MARAYPGAEEVMAKMGGAMGGEKPPAGGPPAQEGAPEGQPGKPGQGGEMADAMGSLQEVAAILQALSQRGDPRGAEAMMHFKKVLDILGGKGGEQKPEQPSPEAGAPAPEEGPKPQAGPMRGPQPMNAGRGARVMV